jgi:hypothetical protein
MKTIITLVAITILVFAPAPYNLIIGGCALLATLLKKKNYDY